MGMQHVVGLAAGLLAVAAPADGREYLCTNKDLEVSCSSGRCQSSDSFTPSSVSLNLKTRRLTMCMYSQCLEGRAALVLVNKAFVIAQGGRLRSHSVPREHRSGVVVIDVADQSGSMIVFNYRSPLTCEAQ